MWKDHNYFFYNDNIYIWYIKHTYICISKEILMFCPLLSQSWLLTKEKRVATCKIKKDNER
jgi:hypothetical protein